ncbi:MAG: YggS family pyridoxal phosphate-dependent enzyme [Treponema sp.]|nr:YggS family pyridoxal phosphate-dependent enzyme [Treponema sp.]
MSSIQVNLERVIASIRDAEAKAGRKEGSVALLAVSKFHPRESVLDAIAAGQARFGENRVQEAFEKFSGMQELHPHVALHIIGALQRNKAAKAVSVASCVESIDRLEIISELEKHCAKINKSIQIFFEYHTGEATKSGFETYDALCEAVQFCADGNAPHLVPSGFMTMAPFTDDEKKVRASFVMLREVAQKLRAQFPSLPLTELSMGMSGDYRIAIEEGATQVRIGTAIFGARA